MALQNLLHLTRRSALAATIALLAAGAHAAPVTIDFDDISPPPNTFGGPFAFPSGVSEDGFSLAPADGSLQVFVPSFEPIDGFSQPNSIRPSGSSKAPATLGIVKADGSAFLFVGLDGRSFGPVDPLTGKPSASGQITVSGFANGLRVAQDVFDIASGFSIDGADSITGDTGTVVPDSAIAFSAVNLLGKGINRLEITLDGFDTGLEAAPVFLAAADNIRLDTDADVLHIVQRDLLAGQTIPVGSVEITQDPATCLAAVTLKTNYPWCLTEAHLATGDTLGDIPQTKKGNPIPGQFADSAYPACEGEVVFENVTGGSLFAVHAVVYHTVNGTDETAWGAGSAFPGKNWATYVELPGGCQSDQ